MFIVFAILIILFIIFLFTTLQLEIKIIINEGRNHSFITLRIFRGIIRFRFNLSIKKNRNGLLSLMLRKTDFPLLEKQTSPGEVFKLLKKKKQKFHKNIKYLRYILSKIRITNFSVILRIGTEDAAETALLSGGAIALVSSFKTYIENRYDLKNQVVVVSPEFNKCIFDLDFDCIINLKIGHIIIAGIRMILEKIKGGENGGRSSH